MKYSEVFDMHCNHCDNPLPMLHRYEDDPDDKIRMTHPCCGGSSLWRYFIVVRSQPL